jgi:hypothetical protein
MKKPTNIFVELGSIDVETTARLEVLMLWLLFKL